MPVILLRHTRPAIAPGICYGRSDLEPGPDFEAASAAVVAGLPPVARVVTSPLRRARLLAERVATARGLALEEDARIAEIDFGRWEGVAWASIPRIELAAWAADFHGARPHGGENLTMLAERVGAALGDVEPSDPPTLWVCHSGVVRAACALLDQGDRWRTELDFGAGSTSPARRPAAKVSVVKR